MKFRIKILLIAFVLFSSCTITKRKYTAGYSIEWKAKAPYQQAITTTKKASTTKLKQAINPPEIAIAGTNTHNKPALLILENNYVPQEKSTIMHRISGISGFPSDTTIKHSGDDSLQLDKNAKKSGNDGNAAVILSIISVLLLLVGPGLETGTIAYLVVVTAFILLMLLCFAFAVDAISFAFKAFQDFKKEPGKYSGYGTALKGLIFGILCLIYFAVIAIAFFNAVNMVF